MATSHQKTFNFLSVANKVTFRKFLPSIKLRLLTICWRWFSLLYNLSLTKHFKHFNTVPNAIMYDRCKRQLIRWARVEINQMSTSVSITVRFLFHRLLNSISQCWTRIYDQHQFQRWMETLFVNNDVSNRPRLIWKLIIINSAILKNW